MAWTTPMTAVANTAFTAAQFNTYVRDNLLETAPGKSGGGTSSGSYFVKDNPNRLGSRLADRQTVLTSQSTSSGSYTNLATNGPSVTANIEARCMVILTSSMINNSDNSSYVGVAVSGVTTIAASDDIALRFRDNNGSDPSTFQGSFAYIFTTLNRGSTTFTMKYRCNGGTSTFSNRHIMILPF